MMSTIELDHEHGDERRGDHQGRARTSCSSAAPGCAMGMEVVALDDALRARILADVDALSDAALRTLAVAYRPLGAGRGPAGRASRWSAT